MALKTVNMSLTVLWLRYTVAASSQPQNVNLIAPNFGSVGLTAGCMPLRISASVGTYGCFSIVSTDGSDLFASAVSALFLLTDGSDFLATSVSFADCFFVREAPCCNSLIRSFWRVT